MMCLPNKICCDMMKQQLGHETIIYLARFREYGIPFRPDGGFSKISISFCPWCGQALPPPLVDQWFEKLWGMGLDVGDRDRIPDEMKTDRWWLEGDEAD